MANLLQNMLTLQTSHKIPMRMDLATINLLSYYKSKYHQNDESDEKVKLLEEVIKDLSNKHAKELEALKINSL